MIWDPQMQLTYIDLALRDGHITNDEWLEHRAEWLEIAWIKLSKNLQLRPGGISDTIEKLER